MILLTGCGGPTTDTKAPPKPDTTTTLPSNETSPPPEEPAKIPAPAEQETERPAEIPKPDGNLKVHFLDVGQADCILIQAPTGENILIDAGNNDDADTIVSYLNTQGVKKVDILVGTHPHEDHIGSLDTVINTFDIGQVYMPKVTHATKTFEDVLIAIKNKGLKITPATGGANIDFSPNTKVEIIAPNSAKYESINNYSAVIKLTYGKTSFLFTGDAEDISENEMLAQKYDLKAGILKVGHHGSSSSTTQSFINSVSPQYAVISVGKGNDYGHPHKEVLNRLSEGDIQVLRTDESGTIIFTTDGKKIEVKKNETVKKTNATPAKVEKAENNQSVKDDTTVYITKSGKKYHVEGCNSLSKSKIPIKLSEAKKKGYGPCKNCNPPQ